MGIALSEGMTSMCTECLSVCRINLIDIGDSQEIDWEITNRILD